MTDLCCHDSQLYRIFNIHIFFISYIYSFLDYLDLSFSDALVLLLIISAFFFSPSSLVRFSFHPSVYFLFLSFDNFPGCLLPLIKYLLPLVLQVSVRTPYHFPSLLPLLASHIKISLSYIPIHSCSLALFSLTAFFFLFLFISLFPIFILLSLTLSLLQCNSRVNYLHVSVFMYHNSPS